MIKVLSRPVRVSRYDWPAVTCLAWTAYAGMFMLSFLQSKAAFMGELYPFGLSFLAAVCVSQPRFAKVALLGTLTGAFLAAHGWILASYWFTGLLLFTLLYCTGKVKHHWLIVPGLTAAVNLLSRGTAVFITGNELYAWLGVGFESFFAGILTLVACTGLSAYPKIAEGKTLTVEERTSIGVIALGGLVGIADFNVWGIGMQSVVCRWLILWASYIGGPGAGAAVGVATGLIPSIQGILTTGPIAFYALSGLLGGVFYTFKKPGVIIGFALANLMLSLFFSEQLDIVQTLRETGLAVIGFLLVRTPIFRENAVISAADLHADKNVAKNIAGRLLQIGEMFYELEDAFVSSKKERSENSELNELFNKVASKVCEGCSLYRVCWEQDFYRTYRAMLEACTKLETSGSVCEKDFGADLKRRCMRLRELSIALNSQLEIFKVINAYEKEVNNCRELIRNQLKGVGAIVSDLSEEIQAQAIYRPELEVVLKERLKEKGLDIKDISVSEAGDEIGEITVSQVGCKETNWCKAMIAPNISQVLGKTYTVSEMDCTGQRGGLCSFTLTPGRALEVKVGVAQCPKEGLKVSGDVCSSFELPGQRFALVMSDGMGAGEEAYAESATALRLLERLLRLGFSYETIIKTVNTIMFLRSGQENFVTLDVVVINQVSGMSDFIKIGGAPSLIYSPRGLKAVQAQAPPAGILDHIDLRTVRNFIAPGQVIIMMSDGVWEAIHQSEGPDGWLEDVLKQLNMSNPSYVAGYLLYLARKISGNKARDDMCIQVARVETSAIA